MKNISFLDVIHGLEQETLVGPDSTIVAIQISTSEDTLPPINNNVLTTLIPVDVATFHKCNNIPEEIFLEDSHDSALLTEDIIDENIPVQVDATQEINQALQQGPKIGRKRKFPNQTREDMDVHQ